MNKEDDLGFTFRVHNGEYTILRRGKRATTLRGQRAAEFSYDVSEMNFAELQQLMARLTGNYKHGNERTARNHPRNQP